MQTYATTPMIISPATIPTPSPIIKGFNVSSFGCSDAFITPTETVGCVDLVDKLDFLPVTCVALAVALAVVLVCGLKDETVDADVTVADVRLAVER